MRDLQNKRIAGVCAGFARYLDVDPVLVRVIWLALAFGAGIGFTIYSHSVKGAPPPPAIVTPAHPHK